MKAAARRYLPSRLQSLLRGLYYRHPWVRKTAYAPVDLVERLTGRHDPLVPPRSLLITGDGDFRAIGREFLGHFVELGGLRADEDVLEVGCGLGRMAVALAGYLKGGSYRGFDIVPDNVRWAREHVAGRHPDFHFDLADIRNGLYNPRGRFAADEYRFPYDDRRFDFVLLTSVFTHTLPPETRNYLGEIARVLRPGGRCFATFFLLDAEASRLLDDEARGDRFGERYGGCRVVDGRIPEASIAYEESRVREMLRERDLELLEPIHRGTWCGRSGGRSFQDIVIARKPA